MESIFKEPAMNNSEKFDLNSINLDIVRQKLLTKGREMYEQYVQNIGFGNKTISISMQTIDENQTGITPLNEIELPDEEAVEEFQVENAKVITFARVILALAAEGKKVSYEQDMAALKALLTTPQGIALFKTIANGVYAFDADNTYVVDTHQIAQTGTLNTAA